MTPTHTVAPGTSLHPHARRRWGERSTRVSGRREGAAHTSAVMRVMVLDGAPAAAGTPRPRWHVLRRTKGAWDHVRCTAQVTRNPRGEGGTEVALRWRGQGS